MYIKKNLNQKTNAEVASQLLQESADRYFDKMRNEQLTKVGVNNAAQLTYGSGGLFDFAGDADNVMINNVIVPMGLESVLPLHASLDENPHYQTLTGVTASATAAPTDNCAPSPAAEFLSSTLTAVFGRLPFQTDTIDINEIAKYDNESVRRDVRFAGSVINEDLNNPAYPPQVTAFNNVIEKQLLAVAYLFQNGSSTQKGQNRMLWQGDSSTTGATGYKEFDGLDLKINTGMVDSITTVATPSMDSKVYDFAFAAIDAVSIVGVLSYMEFWIKDIASRSSLGKVDGVWVMRPELWLELSAIYPFAYNTDRGGTFLAGDSFNGNVDAAAMVAQTDQMRETMTIQINNRTYNVVTDEGIVEKTNATDPIPLPNANDFASNIYFVPLRVQALANPVCFMEYVDYRVSMAMASMLPQQVKPWWTDTGVYSWSFDSVKSCFEISGITEQRVILRTPQLAARIDDVKYSPTFHLRTATPGGAYTTSDGRAGVGPVNP